LGPREPTALLFSARPHQIGWKDGLEVPPGALGFFKQGDNIIFVCVELTRNVDAFGRTNFDPSKLRLK
jgi:hypothetical protein